MGAAALVITSVNMSAVKQDRRRFNAPRSVPAAILEASLKDTGSATSATGRSPNAVKDFEKQKHCLNWRRGSHVECVSVTK